MQDEIRANFASNEAGAAQVVAAGMGDPARRTDDIGAYAVALSRLQGVSRVDALTGSYAAGGQVAPPNPVSARFAGPDGTWLSVVPSVEPVSADGERLVHDIRALPIPFPV